MIGSDGVCTYEAELNAPSLEMNAWFLEILIFYEKMMMMVSFFLKMNEACSNAPSLRDEFMVLKKILIWSIFFYFFFYKKKKGQDMSKCPSLTKNLFEYLIGSKTDLKSARKSKTG